MLISYFLCCLFLRGAMLCVVKSQRKEKHAETLTQDYIITRECDLSTSAYTVYHHKETVNTFMMFPFLINADLLNFLFICESWKITVSTKILCSTTVFSIDNNQKCFLSSKSAYYYDFWRSCDTEDWSNDAENSALHHRNKLQFNRYWHRKQLI